MILNKVYLKNRIQYTCTLLLNYQFCNSISLHFLTVFAWALLIVVCRFQSVSLPFHWSASHRPENWSYSGLLAGSLLCRGNKVRQGGHREILDRRRFARNQDSFAIPHLFLNKFNKATISVPISSSARNCRPPNEPSML